MKNKTNVKLAIVMFGTAIAMNAAVARPWVPLTDAVPNLVALYDASDTNTLTVSGLNVNNWADKSVNSYDLDTVNNNSVRFDGLPHINGLTAVNFGYLGYMNRVGMPDIDLANGVCLISVGQAYGGDSHDYGSTSSTNGSSSIRVYETGSGTMTAVVKVNSAGNNFTFANTNYQDGIPFMCAVYYDPAGMAYLRGNGGADTASSTRNSGATFTINAITAGRVGGTASHYHGEMILLNTANIDTIEKVEGYLAWKWGLQDDLPVNHPYKGAAPIVPPAGTIVVIK